MKAHVKINISIHLEDDSTFVFADEEARRAAARLNEAIKYPLQVHYAGVVPVVDKGEAERVIVALGNHINTTFKQMGVVPVTGSHVPDLALAKGGDQEPVDEEIN